jgi:hypothetical protein
MASVRQSNFSLGEIAPEFQRRSDLKAYGAALRRARNVIPLAWGPVVNRPGTKFIRSTKNDGAARLVSFFFSTDANQAYVIEFGDHYIRFHANGATVESSPGVILELNTPYFLADVWELRFAQVGDIITIVHPKYAPRELRRYSHTDWTLASVDFTTPACMVFPQWEVGYPDQAIDASHPIAEDWMYCVTGITVKGVETSLSNPVIPPSSDTAAIHQKMISATDRANVIKWIPDPIYTSYIVYKGKRGIFGKIGSVAGYSRSGAFCTFEDLGYEPQFDVRPPRGMDPFPPSAWSISKQYNAGEYVSNDGKVYVCVRTGFSARSGAGPTGTGTGITDGATIEIARNTNYAAWDRRTYAGSTWEMQWDVSTPPYTTAANIGANPWKTLGLNTDGLVQWMWVGYGGAVIWNYVCALGEFADRWPIATTFFEQRRIFGGFKLFPTRIVASETDRYEVLERKEVPTSDSPVMFDLASYRGEIIRNLMGARSLIAPTSMSEWIISGAERGDPLASDSINAKQHSEWGSSYVRPLRVGDSIFFVRGRRTEVMNLTYNADKYAYVGQNASFLSRHFLVNSQIVDWDYAKDPYGVIWSVRADGKFCSTTYSSELGTYGWGEHDTDGSMESIAVIPEGSEDAVYFIARRVINGATKRYIERMTTRLVTDPKEGIFLDCSVTQRIADSTIVTGLAHLEGKTVVALADGFVIRDLVVTGGQVDISESMPDGADVIHVGLPYTGDIELLDVTRSPGRGAVEEVNQKIVKEVWFEVDLSRGLWVGPSLDQPTKFVEWRQRDVANNYGAIPLATARVKVSIPGGWGTTGRSAIQIRDPLPVTLLSITREVEGGGGG